MIEKQFVENGIRKAKLEDYLEEELRRANYSHIDITKTPTSTNITIYAEKPGLVIGRGGHRIKEIIKTFEEEFGIENPQVDAQELEEPDMDAAAVAKNIAGWLEKGGHPKRVGNTYARRVMESGAVGVQIEIAGKLSGSRGRTEKFIEGYVKKCGETANEYVDRAYEKAVTKPGALGVKVMIMKDMPDYMKKTLQEEEPDLEEIKAEISEDDETDADEDEESEEAEEEDVEEAADDVDEEPAEPEAPEEQEESDEDGGEAADAEADVDYAELVKENIADIKDAIREQDLDEEQVLEAEKANKERVTLIDWLENRVEE